MDRKWLSGAAVSPPALDNDSDGYATDGNPGTGTPPTFAGAHWHHMITEEIMSVQEAAGVTADKTNVGQLLAAINLLCDSQGIVPGGRLTLTTGVPVTTSDVSAATTVYYTPYQHDRIKLYDGTRWKWYTFTELSQATTDSTKSPAAATTNTNYDMFVWDDSGTLRCTRGPTWNAGAVAGSDTARGTGAASTELELFGGRWVNKIAITNGPAARRGLYVGSIRTDGSSQVNDTWAKRHLWNAFHRRIRLMRVNEATLNWTYNTNAYRIANNSSANQLDYLVGLLEDPIVARVFSSAAHSASIVPAAVGIGIDSTTVNSAQFQHGFANPTRETPVAAAYTGYPGLGRHTVAWIENGLGQGGTTTWTGTNAGGGLICGIELETMG